MRCRSDPARVYSRLIHVVRGRLRARGRGRKPGAPLAAVFVGLWSFRSFLRIAISARGNPRPVAVGDVVFTGTGMLLSIALLTLWHGDVQVGAFGVLCVANSYRAWSATLWARGQRVRSQPAPQHPSPLRAGSGAP